MQGSIKGSRQGFMQGFIQGFIQGFRQVPIQGFLDRSPKQADGEQTRERPQKTSDAKKKRRKKGGRKSGRPESVI
jgi:hypothetical protein